VFGVVCVGREKENEEKEIACETLFFLIFVYFALLFISTISVHSFYLFDVSVFTSINIRLSPPICHSDQPLLESA